MQKSTYDSMMEWFEQRPRCAKAISLVNKAITYAVYVAYPSLLVWLACTGSPLLLRAVLVPFISFVLVTVVRKLINAPRPYEVFGRSSVIPKNTKGKSMPSRHVFSISVISMTFMTALPTPIPGAIMLAVSVLLAAVRVLTGVHFPKDVACGLLLGVLSGILGFYMI